MIKTRFVLLAAVLALVMATPVHAEPIFIAGRGHVQNIGWQGYVADNSVIGTVGKSLRLEAIQTRGGAVSGIEAHVQNIGWMAPVPDGEKAGTRHQGLRLEAIKINAVPGWDIECQAHVQNIGWMAPVKGGEKCGTTGKSLRLEAVRLHLVPKS